MKSSVLLLILPIVVNVTTFCTAVAKAQNQDTIHSTQKKVGNILDQMKQEMSHSSVSPDSALLPPFSVPQQLMDDSTKAIYLESLHAYYDYRISGFKHRKEVFAWQLFSSMIIFYVVLLLVISGICFSGIQFYKSMKKGNEEGSGPAEESITEFEASAKGIKVSSPVLGVIILVISLVFFYLYLVYVYPIQEIF